MTRGRVSAAFAIVAVAAVTAACSGGGGSGASGDAKAPIKFTTIATLESQQFSVPQVQTAVEVAVKEINDAGGIDGRPLQASFCNDKFDPNEASTCAREAVSDGAVAVVGGVTPNSSTILPVLEEAGVPWVAGSGTGGPIELKSPISYPINAGTPGMGMGSGARAAALGGPNVVILSGENESSRVPAQFAELGARTAGGTPQTVFAPLGVPDYSAPVATVLSKNPQAVVMGVTPEDTVKATQALRQAGYTGLITGPSSIYPPSSIKALGAAAESIVLMNRLIPTTSTSVPEVKAFVDEMTAAKPDVRIDDLGLNAWTGVHLLAAVLKGKTVDGPKSVVDALGSITTPIKLGTVPDYPGVPNPAPSPDYPRVAVFKTIEAKVINGVLVQQGDFFDPLKPKS